MKYRIIYILFLPIIYFFLKWTYNSIIIITDGIQNTMEQNRSSGICGIIWFLLILFYTMYLDDKYKLINKTIKFLTKKRTFKL